MKIGIVTDIHENIVLLKRMFSLAEKSGCDACACLGDITGYDYRFYDYESSRSASECLRLIRSECKWITAGNHDLNAAGKFPAYSNGFSYPGNWFILDPAERKKISGGRVWCYEGEESNDLSDSDIDYLRSLPEFIIEVISGIPCLFSHYFAPDFTGSTTMYAKRGIQLGRHWEVLRQNDVIFSFSGHSHSHLTGFAYPAAGIFSKAVNTFTADRFFLGNDRAAIILPPLSGDKGRTSFSVFDTGDSSLSIIRLN